MMNSDAQVSFGSAIVNIPANQYCLTCEKVGNYILSAALDMDLMRPANAPACESGRLA